MFEEVKKQHFRPFTTEELEAVEEIATELKPDSQANGWERVSGELAGRFSTHLPHTAVRCQDAVIRQRRLKLGLLRQARAAQAQAPGQVDGLRGSRTGRWNRMEDAVACDYALSLLLELELEAGADAGRLRASDFEPLIAVLELYGFDPRRSLEAYLERFNTFHKPGRPCIAGTLNGVACDAASQQAAPARPDVASGGRSAAQRGRRSRHRG
jgi:hypothetical protein